MGKKKRGAPATGDTGGDAGSKPQVHPLVGDNDFHKQLLDGGVTPEFARELGSEMWEDAVRVPTAIPKLHAHAKAVETRQAVGDTKGYLDGLHEVQEEVADGFRFDGSYSQLLDWVKEDLKGKDWPSAVWLASAEINRLKAWVDVEKPRLAQELTPKHVGPNLLGTPIPAADVAGLNFEQAWYKGGEHHTPLLRAADAIRSSGDKSIGLLPGRLANDAATEIVAGPLSDYAVGSAEYGFLWENFDQSLASEAVKTRAEWMLGVNPPDDRVANVMTEVSQNMDVALATDESAEDLPYMTAIWGEDLARTMLGMPPKDDPFGSMMDTHAPGWGVLLDPSDSVSTTPLTAGPTANDTTMLADGAKAGSRRPPGSPPPRSTRRPVPGQVPTSTRSRKKRSPPRRRRSPREASGPRAAGSRPTVARAQSSPVATRAPTPAATQPPRR